MGNLESLRDLAEQLNKEQPDQERRQSRPEPPGGAVLSIKDMLAEFDFLALIQADTGEQGRRSVDRVDFDRCPVCGHNNCFSYYPGTASWSCFGASNATGYEGGTALEYYKATRGANDAQAVKWLRDQTGHPYATEKAASSRQDTPKAIKSRWQVHRADFSNMPDKAPELIGGLMRQGRKGIIAGASKSHKSWLAINLAISVATGGDWLGFVCSTGRVLYLNMEVAADVFPYRLKAVADAKGADAGKLADNLDYMNMRGFYSGMGVLAQIVESQAGPYSLVILDPLYKAFNGDENKAADVGEFCRTVDTLCEDIGCAFMYVHHHSKGAKGEVAAIDRASGSGVFARDPDFICDVTRIESPDDDDLPEGQRAYELSFELRDLVTPPPLHAIFDYPLHRVDAEGVTEAWRPRTSLGRNRGGKATAEINKAKAQAGRMETAAKLAAAYYAQGVPAEGLLLKDAAALVGMNGRALANALEGSELFEIEKASARKRYVRARNAPRDPPPTLDLASG